MSSRATDRHTIKVHHIGGRDGEIGDVAINDHFLDDYFFYIYDADERCLPQVVQLNQERGRHVEVLPYIIDEQPSAPTSININFCPCSSSVAASGEHGASQYTASALLGDYMYQECFRTMERIEGTARSVDSLADEKGLVVDFLSMDTNGTESRVISGARKQLTKHATGIICEVEFREIYKNQVLFGDLSKLAHELGFNFIRFFDRGTRQNLYRAGIGWRGDGLMMLCDALFLKDLDRLEAENADPQAALLKLAFLALNYNQVEYALDALVRAFEKYECARLQTNGPRYIVFLAQIYALYRSTPQFNQPKFSELFTFEEALARFDAGEQRHPWVKNDVQRARRNYFRGIDVGQFRHHFPRLLSPEDTPFEILLRQNGFAKTADTVRDKRIKHATMTAQSLHFMGMQEGAPLDLGPWLSELMQTRSSARARWTDAAAVVGGMLPAAPAKGT